MCVFVCMCASVCALASHEIFLKSITGFWARLRLVLASPSPRSGPGLAWLGQFQRLQQKVFCFLLTVCSFVVVVFVIVVVVVVAFLLYLFVVYFLARIEVQPSCGQKNADDRARPIVCLPLPHSLSLTLSVSLHFNCLQERGESGVFLWSALVAVAVAVSHPFRAGTQIARHHRVHSTVPGSLAHIARGGTVSKSGQFA